MNMARGRTFWSGCNRWLDRSFSRGWGRQVIILSILLLFCIFVGAVILHGGRALSAKINADKDETVTVSQIEATGQEGPAGQTGPILRTLELMLDPGSFNQSDEEPFPVWAQLVVTLIGAVFFTALLITVLGNSLGNRIDDFKKGRVRYSFNDHVLILGANSMLVNMLREFIQTGVHEKRKIVVLTTQDTEQLRDKIESDIPGIEHALDVTWLSGSRIIEQTLHNVQVDDAYSIYILGEDDEIDHDSINLECWRLVKSICHNVRRPVQCYLVVDRVSTYHVLQFGKREQDNWLYLNIINSLENWAQRVLVSREYDARCGCVDDKDRSRFPAIDRDGIDAASDKTVRFVVYGMTQVGYAMASTVAHIAHFPNFKEGKNRTKICFIAPDIREEMDFFLGHYDNVFRLSHACHVYWDKDGKQVREVIRTPDEQFGDFLDIEWEFIDASIESENVRSLLVEWASDEKEYLSMALCGIRTDANIAASLYLPEAIYAKDIPVFVYQPLSGEVLKYANNTVRYSNVYPFGMKDECYDPLFRKRIVKAKRINYLYQLQSARYADPDLKYEGMPAAEVLEEYWNTRLEHLYKLSNLYAANSIPVKLRSVGIVPEDIPADAALTQEQVKILSRTEHNRWNMERLLLGTQPLPASERKEINRLLQDPALKAEGKARNNARKAQFYHKDIAPYDDLLPESQHFDEAIVINILDVLRNV